VCFRKQTRRNTRLPVIVVELLSLV